ncbi:MAG: hypothetical protein K2X93_28255 [Candidatus Obscuribacterales bacterium]|nr:hypothetical protein [Candidatus Obscuribacterales bacterium]
MNTVRKSVQLLAILLFAHAVHSSVGFSKDSPANTKGPAVQKGLFSVREKQIVEQEMVRSEKLFFGKHYVGGAEGLRNSKAEHLVLEAQMALEQGKAGKAKELATKTIAALDSPDVKAIYKTKEMLSFDKSRACCLRGHSNFELKMYSEALDDLGLSLRLCPDYSIPYRVRAKVYQRLNKNDLAAEDLARASQLRSLPKMFFDGLEISPNVNMIIKDKIKQSMEVMDAKYYVNGKVSSQSSNFERLRRQAVMQMNQSSYVKAADLYSAAIIAYDDPQEKRIYKVREFGQYQLFRCFQGRAYCQLMLKDWERAIDNLSEAIKLFPEIQENYINRGKAYMAINRRKEAEADFAVAKVLRPNQPPKFIRNDPDFKRPRS